MTGTLEYSSNNSGGSWWVSDSDWHALEAAGWTVDWFASSDDDDQPFVRDGRFLGALAKRARKDFATPAEGVAEWERVVKQDATEEGCNCCGNPHEFAFTDATTGKKAYLEHEYAAVASSWS